MLLWALVTCLRLVGEIVGRIFEVREEIGEMEIDTPELRSKVSHWLGGTGREYEQTLIQPVITIFNVCTREETKFNPIRGKRPVPKPESSESE